MVSVKDNRKRFRTVIYLFVYNCPNEIHKEKQNRKRFRDIHKSNTRNKDKLVILKAKSTKTRKQRYCLKINLYIKCHTLYLNYHLDFPKIIRLLLIENPLYNLMNI